VNKFLYLFLMVGLALGAMAARKGMTAAEPVEAIESDSEETDGSDDDVDLVSLFEDGDPNVALIRVAAMNSQESAALVTDALRTVPGVRNVQIDLDDHAVFVRMSELTPGNYLELELAIADAGFSTENLG
jgi:copper chaperone CopZ